MKYFIVTLMLVMILISCGKSNTESNKQTAGVKDSTVKHKIEFIELGSVNCIPCKKMQPVMESIEKRYGGLVKVTFHDVWKDEAAGKKYGIQLIPTQVFLDDKGVELFRHEGFFPEEDIDKFLQSKGVNPINQ